MNANSGSYQFSICFGGENEIPISSLCKSLDSLNSMLVYAQDNDAKCEYNLVAFKPGSVDVDLVGRYIVPAALFTINNYNYIESALSLISEWVKIKTFLKGKPPKIVQYEGEQVMITGDNATVYVTDFRGAHLFENAALQGAVFCLGGALEGSARSSFILKGEGDKDILNLSSDAISDLSAPVDFSEFTKEHPYSLREKNIFLEVRTSVMVGNAKWTFGYRNHGIPAKIEDEDWLRKVKAGLVDIRGRMGVYADLRIEGTKDKKGTPIDGSESYFVEKIHSIQYDISTEDQTKIE